MTNQNPIPDNDPHQESDENRQKTGRLPGTAAPKFQKLGPRPNPNCPLPTPVVNNDPRGGGDVSPSVAVLLLIIFIYYCEHYYYYIIYYYIIILLSLLHYTNYNLLFEFLNFIS